MFYVIVDFIKKGYLEVVWVLLKGGLLCDEFEEEIERDCESFRSFLYVV